MSLIGELVLIILSLIVICIGLIGWFVVFYNTPKDELKEKKYNDKTLPWKVVAVIGSVCVCSLALYEVFIRERDVKKESKYNDGYYGTEQYYKDAYEYYKDKDNWNRDYGDKYGYRY